ncbi:MAG: TrbI/VirB10 family protein [Candidatus Obscuribacterales bacterium]|nr:TrbI/VirB10 family protein [Candidatus Obscuribacterales bacterium]
MKAKQAPNQSVSIAFSALLGISLCSISLLSTMNAAIAQGYSPPGGAVPGLTNGVPQGSALTPPPVAGGNMMGLVPKFDPAMFQQMQASRVMPGTVLTGILENEVSSKNSKSGDIFFIRLEDGYISNGKQLVPPQSKILGTVTCSISSKTRKGAAPGSVSIALQTLILPDGRTLPFTGFIEHNPQDDASNQSNRNPMGTAGKYAKQTGYGAMNFVTRRVGFPMYMPNVGAELTLKKGEVMPIRLNGPIDISKATLPVSALPNGQMAQANGGPTGMGMGMPPQNMQSSQMPPSMNGAFPGRSNQMPPQAAQPIGMSAGQMGSLSQQPPAMAPYSGTSGSNGGYVPGLSTPQPTSIGRVPGLGEPF